MTDIAFFAVSDFSGLVRGRGVPESRLGEFLETGCGWVPADQAITAFDAVGHGNPFGASGDLRLVPDRQTEVRLDAEAGRAPWRFFLCDMQAIDGSPWSCCGRTFLKSAIGDLEQRHGLRLVASFEHELSILGDPEPAPGFSMRAFRRLDALVAALVRDLEAADILPEMVLPEFGPGQLELPLPPAPALTAADQAVILREIARDVAERHGRRASFAPKVKADAVGNGVHIHFSLTDECGRPVTYDADGPGGLSAPAASFAAGILAHLDGLVALTAPSVVSYLRLQPHHWATAFACLGLQNREAAIRICPPIRAGGDPARGHHLEYRAADATSSPYLALGALIRAGMAGLEAGLSCPPLVDTDPAELEPAAHRRLAIRPLPGSLDAALDALEADRTIQGWADPAFWQCYLALKRTEFSSMADLAPQALCDAYARVY